VKQKFPQILFKVIAQTTKLVKKEIRKIFFKVARKIRPPGRPEGGTVRSRILFKVKAQTKKLVKKKKKSANFV
jgi:hypothetical protein